MNREQLEALHKKYIEAEGLRKNIEGTHSLIEGIRRRQEKGTSIYSISIHRDKDSYSSQVYVKVPETVIAAIIPALKAVLAKMREDFKTLPE